MIGRVINKLKTTGKYDNTLMIVLGDHGFLTGQHGPWFKHVTFKEALKAPLIIKMPKGVSNKKVNELVEFVDIYPTICEAVGINKPAQLQGNSLLNTLMIKNEIPTKKFVFSRYENMEAIKSEDFLFTQFINPQGEITHQWLFDHRLDPDENNNVVNNQKYKTEVNRLKISLNEHHKRLAE